METFDINQTLKELIDLISKQPNQQADTTICLGDATINNNPFQIHLTITPNKKNWIADNEIRFSDLISVVTSNHDNTVN